MLSPKVHEVRAKILWARLNSRNRDYDFWSWVSREMRRSCVN